MTVNPLLSPAIGIVAASSNTICDGTQVTFSSSVSNEGAAPQYKWFLNNTLTGITTSTFTSSALQHGDEIKAVLVSNAICATPATDTSGIITMTVNPNVTPTITLAATSNNICACETVTFTATPIHEGTALVYAWFKNGVIYAGVTGTSLSTSGLNDGDTITVQLTSNAICRTVTTVVSNQIILNVDPILIPVVAITANPSAPIFAQRNARFARDWLQREGTPVVASDYDNEVVLKWNDLILDVERFTPGFLPPVSARAYGYIGLTAYEVTVPGMPDHHSLGDHFAGLDWPSAPKATIHYPTALNNAYATIIRKLFPTVPAGQLSEVITLQNYFNQKFGGQLTPQVYSASVDWGNAVAEAVSIWSDTDLAGRDGYLNNSDPAYVPPSGPGLWTLEQILEADAWARRETKA